LARKAKCEKRESGKGEKGKLLPRIKGEVGKRIKLFRPHSAPFIKIDFISTASSAATLSLSAP